MNVAFSSCLLAAVTLSHPDLSPSQTLPIDRHSQEAQSLAHISVKVPFRLYWGYLIIAEGSIGNVHELSFEVDTGAYPSVIDQKIVQKLGLPEQPSRVNLSRKGMDTRLVVVPSLVLGPVRAESIPVLSQDLSFFQRILGHKVDGIVGLDVLGKGSFTINYRAKEMAFGAIENLTSSTPFVTETPVVTLSVRVSARQLRVVVDTGAPDLMLFQSRVPEAAGLQLLGLENVADASGTFQRRKVRIPELYLGDESTGSQVAFVMDDQKDEGDAFDGILGFRELRFSKIALDFERRRFWWKP
jgi:predicted aspartyl protease